MGSFFWATNTGTNSRTKAKYLEYAGDPWITDFAELRPLMEARVNVKIQRRWRGTRAGWDTYRSRVSWLGDVGTG